MLAVIILFVLGFGVGLLIRKYIDVTKAVDRLVTIAIWFLLFVLGAGVGFNHTVMGNLRSLGLWALVIAFGAIAGSIGAVAIVQHLFFKQKGGSNEG